MGGKAWRSFHRALTTQWIRPPDVNGPDLHGWTWQRYTKITSRGVAVFGFGIACIVRGFVYLHMDEPEPMFSLIEEYLSATVFGALWIILGAWHLLSGALRRWVVVLSVDAGVFLCWGVAVLVGALITRQYIGISSAATTILLAVLAQVVLTMMDPPVADPERATEDPA